MKLHCTFLLLFLSVVLFAQNRVGINTSSPQFNLDVRSFSEDLGGNLQLGNQSADHFMRLFPGHDQDPKPFLLFSNLDTFRVATSGMDYSNFKERITVLPNGNTGINPSKSRQVSERFVVFADSAFSVILEDQNTSADGTIAFQISTTEHAAQSITCGESGFLTSVVLFMRSQGPGASKCALLISDSDQPGGLLLHSQIFVIPDVSWELVQIDLAPHLQVITGQELFFEIKYDADADAEWGADPFDWYSGGLPFQYDGSWNSNPDDELALVTLVKVEQSAQIPVFTVSDSLAGTVRIKNYNLPLADGLPGSLMRTDGNGNLDWVDHIAGLADADGDTRIHLEKNPDEDIIRFDIAGSERWKMTGPRLEPANTVSSIFIGKNAGEHDGLTSHNIGIGKAALQDNETGFNLIAIGDSALANNTTGQHNTAIGSEALVRNTEGCCNTAIGYWAMRDNNTGSQNTGVGYRALLDNISGRQNTAFGHFALGSTTTGSWNTAVGRTALYNNTTGQANTAVGAYALNQNSEKSNLVAVGDSALFWTGWNAVGNEGKDNTGIGSKVLFRNRLGEENTAGGSQSQYFNNVGDWNTSFGFQSLYQNVRSGNSAFGASAGDLADDSEYCTAIGFESDIGSLINAYENSTALGYDANVIQSNQVRIGNISVTSIGGQVAWSNYSDGRFKTDVQEDVQGLTFIRNLRPVSYRWNIDALHAFLPTTDDHDRGLRHKYDIEQIRYSGFIAQEVEQAAIETGFDFSGVDKPENDESPYALRYAEFVVPLVKAVQELHDQLNEQKIMIEILQAEIQTLKAEIPRQ